MHQPEERWLPVSHATARYQALEQFRRDQTAPRTRRTMTPLTTLRHFLLRIVR